MQVKNISVSFEEYTSLNELKEQDKMLCLEAEKALSGSHSPYSKFRVGAAVLLQSGKIIHGSNQENAAFPSGLCAERVALFSAGAQYPNDPVLGIAVTAQAENFDIIKPVTPCGACLQVMAEYEKKQIAQIDILFYCLGGTIWKTTGIKNLLPFVFFEERLKE